MQIEPLSTKQIRFVKNMIRRDMAKTVREMYKSWGISDTRFCRYMGEALHMSTEGVYLFLCRRERMDKGLMEPGKLPEILEKVFAMYTADENVDNTIKETARREWAKTHEQQLNKIGRLVDQYSLANKVSSFRKHDYDLMSDLDDDLAKHKAILYSFELVKRFLSEKWPDDSSKGLSAEETVALRDAIGVAIMSSDYLSYMRKKYRNYKK